MVRATDSRAAIDGSARSRHGDLEDSLNGANAGVQACSEIYQGAGIDSRAHGARRSSILPSSKLRIVLLNLVVAFHFGGASLPPPSHRFVFHKCRRLESICRARNKDWRDVAPMTTASGNCKCCRIENICSSRDEIWGDTDTMGTVGGN